jgi:hypothetical protein
MSLRDRVARALGERGAAPALPLQLAAGSVESLAAAIGRLRPREEGWIALSNAQRLFSAMEPRYAFGEMDDAGRARIAAFAERAGASFSIKPVEWRVYFTRMSG